MGGAWIFGGAAGGCWWAGLGVGGRGAGLGVGGLERSVGVALLVVIGFDWAVTVAVETVSCFVLPLDGGGR